MGVNIHLKFHEGISTAPIVCHLTRYFDLDFNISKARISSRKDGFMVLELLGSQDKIDKALVFLEEQGVIVTPAAQRVTRDEVLCVECGLCTAICPTQALHMNAERRLVFDTCKCVVCGRCIKMCPSKAMEADIESIPNILD